MSSPGNQPPKPPLSGQFSDVLIKLLIAGSGGSTLYFLFDEVPKARREKVSQWVNWQMAAYPSQFILTSRPHGYDGSLFQGVAKVGILDFRPNLLLPHKRNGIFFGLEMLG